MKHHYIPEFFLKQWTSKTRCDDTESLVAFRIDLKHVPSSYLAPAATAREQDLYALSTPVTGLDPQIVETQLFQKIDDSAALALDTMLSEGLRGLTHQQRCSWVWFIMSLRTRTPEAVSLLDSQGLEHLHRALTERPEEYKAIAEPSDPQTLKEWTEVHLPGLMENFGKLSLDKVIGNSRVGDKILNMKWFLWDFSRQRNHLLLSDRPCIFTANFDDPDLIVALPVSPWKAFLATRSDPICNRLRELSERTLLMRINESSVAQAQRRVYALDKSPHRFIVNRLEKVKALKTRR